MACIKYLSHCPCPCCLLCKSKIPLLGSKSDTQARHRLLRTDSEARRRKIETAWRLIFRGVNITSQKIEQLLGSESLIPTRVCAFNDCDFIADWILKQNAFSERLFQHGFNFYQMFVPDLLHEFEIGVWKATFTHLLRILYAYGNDTIQELNMR